MKKHIQDIKNNYRKMERELVTQLNYEVGNHQGTAGTNREEIWVDFFRRIVPKKFNIARSVFIIDSKGNCSNEVDIAIYDEQYTPYIFNYGSIKFIPVEAVAAVVQCKSNKCESNNLIAWIDSVEKLNTSADSVVRLATTIHVGARKMEKKSKDHPPIQTATKPMKILCYISPHKIQDQKHKGKNSFDIIIEAYQNESKKKDDSSKISDDTQCRENSKTKINNEKMQEADTEFKGNLKIKFNKNKNLFDVLCQYNRADKDQNDNSCQDVNDNREELQGRKLDDYRIEENEEEYTLLSFIFQFNQMLMLINNPMFFPHKAYVDMFNGKTQRGDE